MDHSYFLVETPGTTKASDERQIHSRYYTVYSIGNSTHSNPDVAVDGTAEWSGVMLGFRISDPDIFIKGDANITVSNLSGHPYPLVDVEFSNIKNEKTQSGIENMVWSGLKLKDGSFGLDPVESAASLVSRHPASIGISGRFYGRSTKRLAACSVTQSETPQAVDHIHLSHIQVRLEANAADGERKPKISTRNPASYLIAY